MEIIDINGNKRECLKAEVDKKWPGFVRADFESKVRVGYRHSEWYPISEFLKNNPLMKNLVSGHPLPKDDLGVVTSAGKQSLTDKTKNWLENIYTGFPVWIARGKGEGQTRVVMKNNRNTLFLNLPWQIKPNKTSQYVISHNVNNPQALGNILPKINYQKIKKQKLGKKGNYKK